MALKTQRDRKAVADRIRELALLVEAGCADVTIAQTATATKVHHKLEIVEMRRELLWASST